MKKQLLTNIVAALFILLFVYAATSKLIDYQKFRAQLGQSPLLTIFAGWIAWVIPAIELLITSFLFSSRYRIFGLYASLCLMAMFTFYIIAITRFSEFVPCSCGGVLQYLTWNQHLILNIGFVFLGIIGLLFNPDFIVTKSEGIIRPRKQK